MRGWYCARACGSSTPALPGSTEWFRRQTETRGCFSLKFPQVLPPPPSVLLSHKPRLRPHGHGSDWSAPVNRPSPHWLGAVTGSEDANAPQRLAADRQRPSCSREERLQSVSRRSSPGPRGLLPGYRNEAARGDFTLQSAGGGRCDTATAERGERPDGVSVGLQVRYERERPVASRLPKTKRRVGSLLTLARGRAR